MKNPDKKTIEKEAKALKMRFSKVSNRAKFAKENEVPGGAAMVYQHINALKPISLACATAYAKGFGVSLSDISERLAEEIKAAHEIEDQPKSSSFPVHDNYRTVAQYVPQFLESAAGATEEEIKNAIAMLRHEIPAQQNIISADDWRFKEKIKEWYSLAPIVQDAAEMFIETAKHSHITEEEFIIMMEKLKSAILLMMERREDDLFDLTKYQFQNDIAYLNKLKRYIFLECFPITYAQYKALDEKSKRWIRDAMRIAVEHEQPEKEKIDATINQ